MSSDTHLTVDQLRQLCRSRNLPRYQHKGVRLCKCDLVAILNSEKPLSEFRADSKRISRPIRPPEVKVAISTSQILTSNLSKWTVPMLRAECMRRGIPAWQFQGRRLRKRDLIASLAGKDDADRMEVNHLTSKSTLPITETRLTHRADSPADREAAIHAAEARIAWRDDQYRLAMRRYMTGTATAHHDGILRGRRTLAIQAIRDRETPGSKGWREWDKQYSLAMNGQG